MWTVLKFDKKYLELLKQDLKISFGKNCLVYNPILQIQKYKNKKTINKKINLLGDYIFCYDESFTDQSCLNRLKFLKGLKYILSGYESSQLEIKNFITKCKEIEDKNGYISQSMFEALVDHRYKFLSGPFTDQIFKIINLQKNKIKILLGEIKTTIDKRDFLYNPV
jgi:hypothetical protein